MPSFLFSGELFAFEIWSFPYFATVNNFGTMPRIDTVQWDTM